MRLSNWFCYIALFSLLMSCKDDQVQDPVDPVKTLEISVQPLYGGQPLYLDSTYTTPEGYDVQFLDIKFYMGNPSNGGVQLTDAALFNYRDYGTTLYYGQGSPSDFSALTAKLGIDSVDNHGDPVTVDPSSWLYISNANDMHWGWNPGYIFVKIEAKVDTIADGNPLFDHNVVFHIGKEENIQTLNFTGLLWQAQSNLHYRLPMKLDMLTFLQNGTQTIDLKNEFSSHTMPGQEVLSLKVIENFKAALSTY